MSDSVSLLKNIRHRFEYVLVRIIIAALYVCPLPFVSWMARRFGDIAYLLMVKRRKVALSNLDRAFGPAVSNEEKARYARDSFRHMALSLVELLLVSRVAAHPERHFRIQGQEHLEKARKKGCGILFIISHLGSWEYLAFLHFLTKINCYVVVKDIRNPYLDTLINDCRRKASLTPVPKKNSARKIFSILKDNDLAAILMDQWSGPEGLWIPFFGQETSTTSIAVRIAKKTGAVMVPGRCVRVGEWKYSVEIDPEICLKEGPDWEAETTAAINLHLENQIRRYPSQWTWGHKRWKPKPSASR